MSHRAPGGGAAQRAKTAATSVLAWHDARPRASFDTARGWWWAALVAASFIWMSNPLLFIPGFYLSLDEAVYWTKVVAVISLPWLRLPRVPWPWLVFLGLCLLSQLWTINDVHTDLSNAVYVKVTALAVVVAANCGAEVVCVGLAAGGVVTTGLSLYTYRLDVPGASYLAMGEDGVVDRVLAGIGTNENILAYTLVVSLAATLALGRPAHRGVRAGWWGALGVQAYGLYLANSGTGYQTAVALLLVMAGLAIGPRLTPVRSHRVLVGAVVSLAVLLVVSLVGVSALLGKQLTTFSGRMDFWRATVASTLDRAPILGSGWGSVWEHPWDPTPPNEAALDIYERAGYALSHGHNFFVDVLPELGFLGVAVALLMVVYAIRQVRRCGLYPGARDPLVGRLVLLVLVALLASGVTEPMLTVPLGWWSLALVVAMSRQRVLPRSPRGTRARRAAPQRPVSVPAEVMS